MSNNTILATAPLTTTNYILKATGTTIGNSLIFDNGTNVGIGNTNTSYTLDVSGTGRFTGTLNATTTFTLDGTKKVILRSAQPAASGLLSGSALAAEGNFSIYSDSGVAAEVLGMYYWNGSTYRSALQVANVSSGSSNLILMKDGGNVGIGTSSPATALDVNGSIRLSGTGYVGFGGGNNYIEGDNANNILRFGTNNVTRVTINASGNVGIGTSSPANRLDVIDNRSNYGVLKIENDSTSGYSSIEVFNSSGSQVGAMGYANASASVTAGNMYTYSSGNITFLAGGTTERMRITSGGNVVINATSTGSNLEVFGAAQNSANTSNAIFKVNSNSTNALVMGTIASAPYACYIQSGGSGTYPLSLNPNGGNVVIGTVSDNGYKLNCNGQPGANGYTLWTNYSDSRLKENITDLDATNVLDKICAIRPVTYNYNELSGFDEETRARRISGFIAQELMEVFPEMVGTIKKDDVEYYDTNLSNLTLYLVKAIQEQQALITSLQARLETLENK
jgi:hypothetical protein